MVYRVGGVAAVVLAAAAAALLVWLGLRALSAPGESEVEAAPGRLAAPATPARVPDQVAQVKAPSKAAKPLKLAKPGVDILLKYDECPAKCLVDLLEDARPKAAIGAWCRAEAPETFVCISVVDDPAAGVYDCKAWLVQADKRVGIEILRTGPTGCPSRPMTPPADVVAR